MRDDAKSADLRFSIFPLILLFEGLSFQCVKLLRFELLQQLHASEVFQSAIDRGNVEQLARLVHG